MALDLERLGQNIRFRRTGRGWSLGELAEQSGVSKAYLSDLENGRGGRPNIQYLLQIASCFQTTIDELISGANEEESGTSVSHEDSGILPPGLLEFARQENLADEEILMLAQLHFRGSRPRDAEAWRAIFQVIKAVSGASKN